MGQQILLFFAVSLLHAQVSLTTLGTPHKEDFNSLINTGNSAVLPPGWLLLETGTSPTVDQKYTASTGALNSGDAYSFGAPSSTERAYGMLQSGTNVATIGAGSVVGEMSLIGHRPRNATVVAQTAMRLLAFDIPSFNRLLDEMPVAQKYIYELLEARAAANRDGS